MKSRLILLLLILLLDVVAQAQSTLKLIKSCDLLTQVNNSNAYKLVMIGNSGCGYSQLAMKELMEFNGSDKVKIFVVEYGQEKITSPNSEYASTYNFIKPSECMLKEMPSFFPQFILLDERNKIVWKKKGWYKKNLEVIREKINPV